MLSFNSQNLAAALAYRLLLFVVGNNADQIGCNVCNVCNAGNACNVLVVAQQIFQQANKPTTHNSIENIVLARRSSAPSPRRKSWRGIFEEIVAPNPTVREPAQFVSFHITKHRNTMCRCILKTSVHQHKIVPWPVTLSKRRDEIGRTNWTS